MGAELIDAVVDSGCCGMLPRGGIDTHLGESTSLQLFTHVCNCDIEIRAHSGRCEAGRRDEQEMARLRFLMGAQHVLVIGHCWVPM